MEGNQPLYLLKIQGMWWVFTTHHSLMAVIMEAGFVHFLYRDGQAKIYRSFEDAYKEIVYG